MNQSLTQLNAIKQAPIFIHTKLKLAAFMLFCFCGLLNENTASAQCPPGNPLQWTWVQNIINQSSGCAVNGIQQFAYNGNDYIRTSPGGFVNGIQCPLDHNFKFYNCLGDFVCDTGVFGTGCDAMLEAAGWTNTPVWTYQDTPVPGTCNTYLGTFFYADCGGINYYFIELEDGRIFDPYFAVDPGYYPEEGQQIRFDYTIKTDVSTPCNISESPITITCFEPYEPIEESPCDLPFDQGDDCSTQPYMRYHYSAETGGCKSFPYSGCGGNANNYETYSECINACNAVVSCPEGDPLQWDWIQEIINQENPCVAGSIYLQEYEDGNFYVKIYPGDYQTPPPSGAPPAPCQPGGATLTYTCEGQFLCRFEPVHSPTPCNLGDLGNLLYNTLIWEYETEEEPPINEPVCALPLDKGTCDEFIQSYYYNAEAGTCQTFIYTGCGGNANNYETFTDCINACNPNVNCPAGEPLEWDWIQEIIANSDGCEIEQIERFENHGNYYFKVGNGPTCGFQDPFFIRYYDCNGNFICLDGLVPLDFPNSCFPGTFDVHQNRTTIWTYEVDNNENACNLPFVQGYSCDKPSIRYYFDGGSGSCQSFTYYGCGGNANNYGTYIECMNACSTVVSCPEGDPLQWDWIQEIINQGKPCVAGSIYLQEYEDGNFYVKIYPGDYHPPPPSGAPPASCTPGGPTLTYTCQGQFLCRFEPVHSPAPCNLGDLGNLLNTTLIWEYETEEEPPTNEPACALPLDEGTCDEFIQRYYFDTETGNCRQFYYKGCGGNANNYETYSDCINACNATVSCIEGDPLEWDWLQQKINDGIGWCPTGTVYLAEYEDGSSYITAYPSSYTASGAACLSESPITTFDCQGRLLCQVSILYPPCTLGDLGELVSSTLIWREELVDEEEPACSLPLDVGTCDDFNPRYYYNSDAGVCQSFVYTGCGGNANNYETYADCVNACSPNHNCPNGNPLEWNWMQDIIANSDGCEVEQIDQFEYNGARYFIVGPGNTCGFQDNFFYRYYDCKGNFICHVGLLPIDFPDSCFPDMFDEAQNRITIWTYEFNCTLEDDPLETTWLKELIINGEGCTIYSIRQFVYNEFIHFEVAPNPNCVSDFYKDYYDCTGNLICSSSIFNDTCDSELSIAASLTPDIWSYNSAGCANPLQTNFVQNWLNADCQPEAIYSFEFEGETFIYVDPGTFCYDYYFDEGDLFYNCNADITCNLTSAFLGYYNFSCFGISESVLISALNDDNLIWTKPCEYELTGEVIQIGDVMPIEYVYDQDCDLIINVSINGEGFTISPISLPDDFTLTLGQTVELSYRHTYNIPESACTEVSPVEIICIREAGGNQNSMDRIECPSNNTTSICAPVSKPASMTMEDFSTSSDPNYMNTMSMQVDEQTDIQQYFTTTTRVYTISDKNGNQKTCETKHHIANQFLQMPEVAQPGTVCEEDLWSYIKIGTDQYKIYADHNGSKGEMMSTCNTPNLICSTANFGVDTKVPNQYNLWATTYFEFPDGTVCESEAMPFYVEVQAKPTATLSAQNKTMRIGEGMSLMDVVADNKSGYWSGENIIYLMTATGENIAYFTANQAGVYKLYYTIRNDNCERSYLLVVEVPSAGKTAAAQASYKTMDTTFNMYPNPTNNKVFIDLPDEALYQISMMDISGKVVKQLETDLYQTNIKINVNDLPKGMYMVELKNESTQLLQKLIVE